MKVNYIYCKIVKLAKFNKNVFCNLQKLRKCRVNCNYYECVLLVYIYLIFSKIIQIKNKITHIYTNIEMFTLLTLILNHTIMICLFKITKRHIISLIRLPNVQNTYV